MILRFRVPFNVKPRHQTAYILNMNDILIGRHFSLAARNFKQRRERGRSDPERQGSLDVSRLLHAWHVRFLALSIAVSSMVHWRCRSRHVAIDNPPDHISGNYVVATTHVGDRSLDEGSSAVVPFCIRRIATHPPQNVAAPPAQFCKHRDRMVKPDKDLPTDPMILYII
jgi:hypothetical protein